MTTVTACTRNPFPASDPDRREIWDILMRRDFEAFVTGDWSMIEGDFLREGFFGIDACKSSNPDQWKLSFPRLETYRDEWVRQAREFGSMEIPGTTMLDFLFDSCRLQEIELADHRAAILKRFDGKVTTVDGTDIVLQFQSHYHLVCHAGRWRIASFVGFLPNPTPTPQYAS